MNSTDEVELRCLFERLRGPVAHQLQDRGAVLFPTGPDDEESWYVDCEPDMPEFFTIETDEIEGQLRAMWLESGYPELARIAGEILEIAHRVRLDEEQSADVSPFMYVMY